MNRTRIAALWIATIAVTWMIVRDTTTTRSEDEPAPAAPRRLDAPARSAPRLPSLRREAPPARAVDEPVFRTALATLETDLADGRWSDADRDRLNYAIRRLEGEHIQRLLDVLFPKLNDGTIKSDVDGSPI